MGTIQVVMSRAMLSVRMLSAIACVVGGASASSEPRPNLRGNNVSAVAPREVELVIDFSSMNSSMFDEINDTNDSLQNSSSDSAGELQSEWGIHPARIVRRALVCHAVFGPQHRFLRNACVVNGILEVTPNSSADLNNNTNITHLDSVAVDAIEKSLVATFGNESTASNVELTSEWGIPHHPIRRALVCHAVFGHHHQFMRRACWFAGR